MRFTLAVSFEGDYELIATFDSRPTGVAIRQLIQDWVRELDFNPDEPIAAPVEWELHDVDEGDKVVAEGRVEGIKTR